MPVYLDTNVSIFLAGGDLGRITPTARTLMESADLLISPMVLLELEYLYEIKRTLISARDVQLKLEGELGVQVCDLSFPTIVTVALNEKWTRDPFDRMIVANAKANALSHLITADEQILASYGQAVW